MTAEERQMLADLFERIRANGGAPRDAQAEAFIADAVQALPFAPYVMAQTVLVQQQGLEAANRRIQELQAQNQSAPPPGETSFLGGLGKALFGGPASPAAGTPPPYRPAAPPQYAPQYAPAQPAPGPWGAVPASGGFLSGALRTAAGVAGGIAVADMLGGLLGGHGGGFGGGLGGGLFGNSGFGGGENVHETVNNFYGAPDQGAGTTDAGWTNPSAGHDLPQDAGLQDSGGFDDNSGGGFDV